MRVFPSLLFHLLLFWVFSHSWSPRVTKTETGSRETHAMLSFQSISSYFTVTVTPKDGHLSHDNHPHEDDNREEDDLKFQEETDSGLFLSLSTRVHSTGQKKLMKNNHRHHHHHPKNLSVDVIVGHEADGNHYSTGKNNKIIIITFKQLSFFR